MSTPLPEKNSYDVILNWHRSAQPLAGDYNNRVMTIELSGLDGFTGQPVAIDPVTGDTFDIPVKFQNGRIIFSCWNTII